MALILYLLPAPPWPWWATALQALAAAAAVRVLALDTAYQTLLWLVAADFLTGMACAVFSPDRHGLSARAAGLGICKKLIYFLLCEMCTRLQAPLHLPFNLGIAAAYFFWGVEGLSITENAGELGVPIPPALTAHLTKLRNLGGHPKKGEML